jgi:hypothetical protein
VSHYATRLRAILNFTRFTGWVDEPEWTEDDARSLGNFMKSEHGIRFAAILRNMTIRQDSSAVQKGDLTACGFAIGFRSAVAVIDSLGIDATHPAGGADD